ncbi:MAG: ribonuclease HII [Patescibacteria group bacterium]
MNYLNLSKHICGLDEAGRGAWAGPLVATAVILPCSITEVEQLAKTKAKDGKLLNPTRRILIYQALKKVKAEIWVEIISARSINNHGIGWANKEIFKRLIKKIEATEFIVDGNLKIQVRGKTHCISSVINADATIPEVILAGIVAKVEKDTIMKSLHQQFPRYSWCNNMGYGTKTHQEALMKYQMTYYHRSIFVTSGLQKIMPVSLDI